MPKAKPMVLNPAKRRKSEIADRKAAELSLTPISELPSVPAPLKNHAGALLVYRRLMVLYAEVIAEVVTAFDLDVLVDYCLMMEQIAELDAMRAAIVKSMADGKKRKAGASDGQYILLERLLAIDARGERKRALAHKLRESLYLTPRARAGAAPPRKPAEPERDEMEDIMAEVGNVLQEKHG